MTTRKRATKHQAFGERIYELREQAQLSQNELAAKASMSRAGLSRILHGVRQVRTRHVLQLARALRLTAAALVEGTDAEALLGNWIPRVQYNRSERDCINANNALVAERAKSNAFDVEIRALRLDLKRQASRIERMDVDAAKMKTKLKAAADRSVDLSAARTEIATLAASERVLSAMVHDLRKELAVTRLSRDKFERALKDARGRRERGKT